MNEQLSFSFDDLEPEERQVYLEAAQMLLNEGDDEGPCEVCRFDAPEHASWCPLQPDADPTAA